MRHLQNTFLATGLVLGLASLAHAQVCPTTMGTAGGATSGTTTSGISASSGSVGSQLPTVEALSNLNPQQATTRQQLLLARARRAAMLRAGQNQASLQVPAGMSNMAQMGNAAANSSQQGSTSRRDSSARSSRAAALRIQGAERTLAYAQSAESQNRLGTAKKHYRRVLRVAPGSPAAGEAQKALDRLAARR